MDVLQPDAKTMEKKKDLVEAWKEAGNCENQHPRVSVFFFFWGGGLFMYKKTSKKQPIEDLDTESC